MTSGTVVMVVVVVTVVAGALGSKEDIYKIQELRAKLLEEYDRETIPRPLSKPAVVKVNSLTVRNIRMDEKNHQINLHGWLHYTWQDDRLTWDADSEKIGRLSFSPKQVWLPDLYLYNSVNSESSEMSANTRVLVTPDGLVLVVPPFDFVADCVADMSYWPSDTHNCTLRLGSWVHDGYTIDFQLDGDEGIKLELMSEENGIASMEWTVQNTSGLTRQIKYYACCSEPYVTIEAHLIITRNASLYNWLIKVPVVLLAFLTTVLFLLPPGAGEKVTFGGVCLILDLIFLIFTYEMVQSAPNHTPLIIQLVVILLVLSAVCVLVAALTHTASHSPFSSSTPTIISSMASALGVGGYAKGKQGGGRKKREEVEMGGGADQKAETNNDWQVVGAVVDRLALIVCVIISVIILISFSSVL